jgi:hypothetical protein
MENTAVSLLIAWMVFVVILMVGWVINIIKLLTMVSAGAEITTLFIVRLVGVPLAPLGAVMGWFF